MRKNNIYRHSKTNLDRARTSSNIKVNCGECWGGGPAARNRNFTSRALGLPIYIQHQCLHIARIPQHAATDLTKVVLFYISEAVIADRRVESPSSDVIDPVFGVSPGRRRQAGDGCPVRSVYGDVESATRSTRGFGKNDVDDHSMANEDRARPSSNIKVSCVGTCGEGGPQLGTGTLHRVH